MANNPTCATCRWWDYLRENIGWCRRYPPQLVSTFFLLRDCELGRGNVDDAPDPAESWSPHTDRDDYWVVS